MALAKVGAFNAEANGNQGTTLWRADDPHFQVNPAADWTIGCYFRCTDSGIFTTRLQPLLAKWQVTKEWILYVQNSSPPSLAFAIRNGATEYDYAHGTAAQLTINADYLVLWNFDHATGISELWVNNVKDGQMAIACAATNANFYVGGDGSSSGFQTGSNLGIGFKTPKKLTTGDMDWLYNGGKFRNAGEVKLYPGFPSFDFLYGFENSSSLGDDSSGNGLTLANVFAVGPTQATGPYPGGPTTATVSCATSLTIGVAATVTITLPSASVGGTDFYPTVSGFSASISSSDVVIADGATTQTFTITPTSAGTGSVGATAGDITVTPQGGITVADPSVPAVSPTTATGQRGATQQMTASGFTGGSVTWSSDHTDRVTVDSSGLCTFVGTGAATITATGVSDTTQHASATLTGDAVTLSVDPTTTTLYLGSTQQITPTVNGAVNTSVNYSSDHTGIATVSSSGLMTGVSAGTATITVTSVADGTVSATVAVTVSNVSTETVLSAVSGFAPGLVPGTTAGFGYKLAIGNAAYSGLVTDPTKIVAEEEPGAYSAFVSAPVGQVIRVKWYDGSGRVKVDFAPQFPASAPTPDPWYAEFPQCQGSTSNSITLAATTGPEAKGQIITILTGTASDQVRMITDYNPTTKVATVDQAWTTLPAEGTYYGLSDGYINLYQQLQDAADANLGGALNGAHAVAWCQVILDRVANLLKVFSHGSNSTPMKTFTYSDVANDHTSRIPTS